MGLTVRYQLNVAFPSGKESEKWKDLVDKLCKRYDVTPNVVIRVALKALDQADKKSVDTDV